MRKDLGNMEKRRLEAKNKNRSAVKSWKKKLQGMTVQERGHLGERIALNYYLGRNFKLIKNNFWGPHGEIDLILEKGDALFFVEVKSRMSFSHGRPAEACNYWKRKHLIHTARFFLFTHPGKNWQRYSFEIIEIHLLSRGLRRIPQAFSLEEGF